MIKNIKLFFILIFVKKQISLIDIELKKYSFLDFDLKNTNVELGRELSFYKKILEKELYSLKNVSIKKHTKIINMLKLIQDHIDYINYKE